MKASAIGTLHGADASAEWAQYDIKVIAAVSGPLEVRIKDEQPRNATLQVQVLPASGANDLAWQKLSGQVQRILESIICLERHPASLIQVTVQVLSILTPFSLRLPDLTAQLRTRLLAVAVNSSMIALLDSAVSCRFVAVAVAAEFDSDSRYSSPRILDGLVHPSDQAKSTEIDHLADNIPQQKQQPDTVKDQELPDALPSQPQSMAIVVSYPDNDLVSVEYCGLIDPNELTKAVESAVLVTKNVYDAVLALAIPKVQETIDFEKTEK